MTGVSYLVLMLLTFNSWHEWFVICWMKIIIIIPSSGKSLKSHDLKLRITAKFQPHMWNLLWQVCILLSHFTVWLSPRDKDRDVWRSFNLGYVANNGDKLKSSCIRKDVQFCMRVGAQMALCDAQQLRCMYLYEQYWKP